MLLVFHSLLTKACNSVFIEKFVSSKLLLFSKLASDNNLLKYSDSSISLKYLLFIGFSYNIVDKSKQFTLFN